ncbi:MAG: M24 family metallopeptidase, partial [Nitrospinae bacterium]|nr:M24 family metallopeptidase [Nitrospinota bacterium]
VTVVIADEAEMLHYFTGFAISENLYRAVVIALNGAPTMIVRLLDEQPFLKAAWFHNRRTFDDLEDPVVVTAQVIEAAGSAAGRIGLDMNSYCMPAKRFQHLTALLPGVTFVDFSDVFRPRRLKKSPREIAVMRKAAGIADVTMRRAIAAAVPGASSRTSAAVASASFIELGADFGRTGPITVGRGWNFLHGKLSDDALQPGDVLHLELVPKVNGYCARLMRPAVMGVPSAELQDAAATLIELQDRQIAAMVPGAVASSVFGIIAGRITDRKDPRLAIWAGSPLMLLAIVGLSTYAGSPVWVVAVFTGILGAGFGLINTPLAATISRIVSGPMLASALSINSMLFFLGGSFGTAVLMAVMTSLIMSPAATVMVAILPNRSVISKFPGATPAPPFKSDSRVLTFSAGFISVPNTSEPGRVMGTVRLGPTSTCRLSAFPE